MPNLTLILLILRVLFNLTPNTGCKGGRVFKTLPEKNLEFIPSKKNGTAIFNLSLIMLLVGVDLISKE